jgi:hypothetical protein
MGSLIDLDEERARRRPLPALLRLDRAIARIEPLLKGRPRAAARAELELLRIRRVLLEDHPLEAARMAERLADILEHPAASGS